MAACSVIESKTPSCSREIIKNNKNYGNKKSNSNATATPTKTKPKTTAHQKPLPSDKNLEITKPPILLELRQTNLGEQVKKQNELIEKLIKKVNTLEGYIIFCKVNLLSQGQLVNFRKKSR